MKNNKEWLRYLELKKERPSQFENTGNINIIFDEDIVEEYEKCGRTIGVVYESNYSIMVVDLVEGLEGKRFAYERLMPAVPQGAVVTMPQYEDKFVLMRQYRHSLRDYQYAFPRGYGEEGLTARENAIKELGEEINATVTGYQYLGNVVADSGINGNVVDVFWCSIDSYQMNKLGDEGIEKLMLLSEEELDEMITKQKITDGYTLAAVGMWKAGKKS